MKYYLRFEKGQGVKPSKVNVEYYLGKNKYLLGYFVPAFKDGSLGFRPNSFLHKSVLGVMPSLYEQATKIMTNGEKKMTQENTKKEQEKQNKIELQKQTDEKNGLAPICVFESWYDNELGDGSTSNEFYAKISKADILSGKFNYEDFFDKSYAKKHGKKELEEFTEKRYNTDDYRSNTAFCGRELELYLDDYLTNAKTNESGEMRVVDVIEELLYEVGYKESKYYKDYKQLEKILTFDGFNKLLQEKGFKPLKHDTGITLDLKQFIEKQGYKIEVKKDTYMDTFCYTLTKKSPYNRDFKFSFWASNNSTLQHRLDDISYDEYSNKLYEEAENNYEKRKYEKYKYNNAIEKVEKDFGDMLSKQDIKQEAIWRYEEINRLYEAVDKYIEKKKTRHKEGMER